MSEESPFDKLRRLAPSTSDSAGAQSAPPPPPGPLPPPVRTTDLPTSKMDTPPPSISTPPASSVRLRKVEIDASGMPRVPGPPAGAGRPTDQGAGLYVPPPPAPPAPPTPLESTDRFTPRRPRGWGGCLWDLLRAGVLLTVLLAFLAVGVLAYGYWSIARTLPSIADLQSRASQFETTRIYDAKGNVLYEIVDPQAGRRTTVPLSKISPYLIAATIATEDKNFYSNPGFDPLSIVRAIYENLRSGGESGGGASTITQQLVRALVLTPDERAQRTVMRKIREIILAAEITRTYPRDQILELYLNEIYYGNLAYGIEAASQTYFKIPASQLSLSQASFLAGLPQAPAVYDIFTNREATLRRQQDVLSLMVQAQCVPLSQGNPVCVSPDDVIMARVEMESYPFTPPKTGARFPHWVNFIRQQLENMYGAETLYRSGYNVYTTLDPDLQTQAEAVVAEQIATLSAQHVSDGALVAMRAATGEIVAMVGSANYNAPVAGQINMAVQPRQTGSAIKPLTYALAFEHGWTPATLIWDVPSAFPDGSNPPYKPINYDQRFHGPVLARAALANSYNIPAVKTLQFIGIYGDQGFVAFAKRLGITTLTRSDYGLALTLGGGEVPLTEMVGAFGTLADGGLRAFPFSIREITDSSGAKIICEQPTALSQVRSSPPPCQALPDNWKQPVISPETAFLISDILSDNSAYGRAPAFGPNSTLKLTFPAAAKTGTTNDFRDNWTVGYTPDLVAGVWVGNADDTPMVNSTGVTGAAPIWHKFMEQALGSGPVSPFSRPGTIVEKTVCGLSGTEPSDSCPPDTIHTELFSANNGPLPKDHDLRQAIFLDPFTGLRQTADCAKYYQTDLVYGQQKTVVAVSDPAAQQWLANDPNGQAWAAAHGFPPPLVWAPTDSCQADSPHPIMSFAYPAEGATIPGGKVEILGQAAATAGFDHFTLDYGLSTDPQGWGAVQGANTTLVSDTAKLADWDTSDIDGPVTLRLTVYSKSGLSGEARVHFEVRRPTPVPSATPTATSTPTVTNTPTATFTPTATLTASPPPTATPTAPPTATASLVPTPTPSDTPPAPTGTPTPSAAAATPTATPTP
jgi:membrane peptidoglycan carboxypeptidase